MNDWFTIEQLAPDTYAISEYAHWEQPHSYLLIGEACCLLIDTGLGVGNIRAEIDRLTDKPITAVATHIHWDHIGGHRHFPAFYVHEAEAAWVDGHFPLPLDQVKQSLLREDTLPEDFDASTYEIFQGTPAQILRDGDQIDLGGRIIEILHTPGHSPGHMCFYERARGTLYTGDLIYQGTLFAFYPSTDPVAYLRSVEKVAALPVTHAYPGHNSLNIPTTLISDVHAAFASLEVSGQLHHDSGMHTFDTFSIWL